MVFCFKILCAKLTRCAEICVQSHQFENHWQCWQVKLNFLRSHSFFAVFQHDQKPESSQHLKAPVHATHGIVEFNCHFCFSSGLECNSQHNNACVLKKLQHHFHVLAIVHKKDGMHHVSFGVLKMTLLPTSATSTPVEFQELVHC